MAYTLKFHDQFSGETGDVDIDNHTPTDLGTSWSQMSGNVDAPFVDDGTETLCQGFFSGTVRQGAIANISGDWNTTSPKQRFEYTQGSLREKVLPILYGNEDGSGYPQGYTAYWYLNYWRIFRVDNGATAPTSVALSDIDTGGGQSSDVMVLTCEPDSQALSVNSDEYTASFEDTTYSTGRPGVAANKTLASDGLPYVKFWEDAGTGPVTASGTPTLTAITASATATNTSINPASGTPSLAEITSTGTAGYLLDATGAATLTEVTANGAVQTILGVYGTPSLTELTASGNVDTTQQIVEASGAATAAAMTAAGNSYRTTVSITVVDGDNTWDDGSNGLVITGTNFVN